MFPHIHNYVHSLSYIVLKGYFAFSWYKRSTAQCRGWLYGGDHGLKLVGATVASRMGTRWQFPIETSDYVRQFQSAHGFCTTTEIIAANCPVICGPGNQSQVSSLVLNRALQGCLYYAPLSGYLTYKSNSYTVFVQSVYRHKVSKCYRYDTHRNVKLSNHCSCKLIHTITLVLGQNVHKKIGSEEGKTFCFVDIV
jgi:hypothetical protein